MIKLWAMLVVVDSSSLPYFGLEELESLVLLTLRQPKNPRARGTQDCTSLNPPPTVSATAARSDDSPGSLQLPEVQRDHYGQAVRDKPETHDRAQAPRQKPDQRGEVRYQKVI
jgi:hypothetical protein